MSIPNYIKNDLGLEPYIHIIEQRILECEKKEQSIIQSNGSLSEFANNYLYYGIHKLSDCWVIREWAPNATEIYVIGDFSDWQALSKYKMEKLSDGNWELKIASKELKHQDKYKLLVRWSGGEGERIPAYTRRAIQDPITNIFSAQVWSPEKEYKWKNSAPCISTPLIYEAHIGMSSEKPEVASYNFFRENILPRIVDLGYNTIQLMAIQEHPYYGSFGYHVSSFFAASSRFGTPEELKMLIDQAHKMGLAVIMDIVHSHAVKNEVEGISRQDGTFSLYFHEGERGTHKAWDSRCFNYTKNEVIAFLLSNCKYWIEEFKFDGFRFDGVTSMIYLDHGLERDFNSYKAYYDGTQDNDAIVYLYLANKLIHSLNPNAITIAEEVSGMPGLATPYKDGGVGFDYRMSMGVADYWIKLIKDKRDEEWGVGDVFYELTNKRADEKTVSYAECHDQALVGDKTIIFRLLDKEMYSNMNLESKSVIVDRGVALHKITRLLTLSTAGNAYLNFMGNEFGHPEWIDFPREGNNWSYHYARRQWSLADSDFLRYSQLLLFDKYMINIAKSNNLFLDLPYSIVQNNYDQVLIFKRGSLLFVFNLNPTESFTDYSFLMDKGEYSILLCSDDNKFGGFNRVNSKQKHHTINVSGKDRLSLYIPSRTAMVLSNAEKIIVKTTESKKLKKYGLEI